MIYLQSISLLFQTASMAWLFNILFDKKDQFKTLWIKK